MIKVVLDNNIIIKLEENDEAKKYIIDQVNNKKIQIYFTVFNIYELIKKIDKNCIEQRIRQINIIYKLSEYNNFLLLPYNDIKKHYDSEYYREEVGYFKESIIGIIDNYKSVELKLNRLHEVYDKYNTNIEYFISIYRNSKVRRKILKEIFTDHNKKETENKIKSDIKNFLDGSTSQRFYDYSSSLVNKSFNLNIDNLSNSIKKKIQIYINLICDLEQHLMRQTYLTNFKLKSSDYFDYLYLLYLASVDYFISNDNPIKKRLEDSNHTFLSDRILNYKEFERKLESIN